MGGGGSGDWARDRSWWHSYSQQAGTRALCEGQSRPLALDAGGVSVLAGGRVGGRVVDLVVGWLGVSGVSVLVNGRAGG